MRNAILVSGLATTMAIGALSAYAGPPVTGTWKSTNGDFDNGREASSWAAGSELDLGNVLHAESWDGSALGGDWKVLCPVVASVQLLYSTVFGGNGHKAYLITYGGGTLVLDGAGPWAGGDAAYVGVIDSYHETRTIQFAGGVKVGAVSNHDAIAHLQGYPMCMSWGQANGAWLGESPNAKPAGYPDYRDANCSAGPTTGHWAQITSLTISVGGSGCQVPTEPSSWGNVKSLYRK
jgi:hypothetical protein